MRRAQAGRRQGPQEQSLETEERPAGDAAERRLSLGNTAKDGDQQGVRSRTVPVLYTEGPKVLSPQDEKQRAKMLNSVYFIGKTW